MALLKKISDTLSIAASTGASVLKTILMSGKASSAGETKTGRLIILANGPSLRKTIDDHAVFLKSNSLMAVNFFANSPEYDQLRPEYYVLADNHFFEERSSDQNVIKLWDNLALTSWDMTLFIPVAKRNCLNRLARLPENVTLKFYNLTPAEGWNKVIFPLFDKGLSMPRPRNVLIPSIMLAIREGYKDIIITGADHSWSKTLWVDDNNNVVSVQPHFYKDNEKERERVRNEYAGYHLHDILNSLTIAFRSYFTIADYARERGVTIRNATPGSFIDAFDRVTLSKTDV